jgi:hypothetical protein
MGLRTVAGRSRRCTTPGVLVVPLDSVDPNYHAVIEAEAEEATFSSDRTVVGR